MQEFTLQGKHILIIGLGMSGRSAAQFALKHQAKVCGIDQNLELLKTHSEIKDLQKIGLEVYLESDCPEINTFDLIILSPGVNPLHPLVQGARKAHISVLGEIELGFRLAKNPILGVTGTNGKTTVTLLITHVLQDHGQQAKALGNVGVPLTKELLKMSPETVIVLELSSYQIETLHQQSLDSVVILNITPDHLDRYGTMEAYAEAKCKIENCLKSHGYLYMEEAAWQNYGSYLKEKNIRLYGYHSSSFIYTNLKSVFREGIEVFELPPCLRNKPSHDLENLLAAYAICADLGVSGKAFIQAWKTFKKPAHRIEFIIEHQGVKYYDDSKGTNIDAVIRAVQLLEGSIILIAGGVDKGAAYTPWIEEFKNKVKFICAIGEAADKIQEQLSCDIPVRVFASLAQAVQQASQQAKQGDVILLSPGCASFDMFKDYAHRGEEFQRIIRELMVSQR